MGLFSQNFFNLLGSGVPTGGDSLPGIETPLAPARPNPGNLPTGPIDLGGIAGTVSGSVPSTSVTAPGSSGSSGGWLQSGIDAMQKAAQGLVSGMQSGAQAAADKASPTSWLLSSRVVSGAVGLIAIAGGLLLFKPTQDIIIQGAKTAAKAAPLA